MSARSPRLVVAPTAPAMTETEYRAELDRHTPFLDDLKTPVQRRKAGKHPDIARAVTRVEAVFQSAQGAAAANDAEIYHQSLVAVRQAIGAWRSVDAQHGEVTWRAAAG